MNTANDKKEITLEEIEKYLQGDNYKGFLKQIPLSIFKMAANEENTPMVIKSVMEALQEHDPQNATEEYAQKLVDAMQKVAKKVLQHKKTA